MANEKKIKAEELSDEQLNEAAGGSAPALDKEEKRCSNCGKKLPYNYPGSLCKKCLEASDDTDAPADLHPFGIKFPDPR